MLSQTTWGRKFFDEHMAYIYANKIDEMIDDQYAQDGSTDLALQCASYPSSARDSREPGVEEVFPDLH